MLPPTKIPKDLVVCFWFDVCVVLCFFCSSTFYFGTDQIWIDYYNFWA